MGFAPLYPPYKALRFAMTTEKNKKGRQNADKRVSNLRAFTGAARTYRVRSPVGVPPRLRLRRPNATAQLQAMLPGTRQDARSGKPAPTGERRPRALTRALPAPVCPQSRERTSQTGRSAGRMMPKAARERTANPPAGTALAPPSGVPSAEGVPYTERNSLKACT